MFFLVDHLGVDLSRGHVFMRKHLADGIDVILHHLADAWGEMSRCRTKSVQNSA